jgi:hypothetical protein
MNTKKKILSAVSVLWLISQISVAEMKLIDDEE